MPAPHHTPGRRAWRPPLATSRALLAGVLMTAGLPPFPWTGVLVVVGLAMLVRELAAGDRPGRTAWWFGLAHQGTLLSWLFMLDPAKSIPSRALVPVQAGLAILYVSLFYLLLGWTWGRLRRRVGARRALLLFPVLWTLMEYMRTLGELGFPWCLSGSAVLDTPLQPLLRAAGELGLGTALAATAVAVFLTGGRRRGAPAVALAGACWLGLAAGAAVHPTPPVAAEEPRRAPLPVAVVQADVALADKWDDAKIDSTKVPYGELTAAAAADGAAFIVWAETAVPAYLRYDPQLMAWTRGVVEDAGVHLFTGFPDAERAPDGTLARYNSSGLFSPTGRLVGQYAKHHLLPIGEAMPFGSALPFLRKLDVGQAEWQAGPPPAPLVVATPRGPFPFGALICFESAFSRLARTAVRAGARCLVVITNDGWFGRSAGPRQHAALARLRAAECGVPVLRAANNGISLITDAGGRTLARLGLGRRGYLMADVAAGAADTAFVRWGHQPLFLALLLWTSAVLVLVPREDEA